MTQNSTKKTQLTDEEKKSWDILKQKLIEGQEGRIEISQAEFGVLCNLSDTQAGRRLHRFKEVRLISMEREKPGNNKSLITWLEYGNYKKEFDNKPMTPPTGIVPLDSPFYLEREADKKCKEKLKNGANREGSRPFIRIRAPKQMGKSSLLLRIQQYLEEQPNHIVGFVDFSDPEYFPTNVFNDLETLLEKFTLAIIETFIKSLKKQGNDSIKDLPDFNEFWNHTNHNLDPYNRCSNYLQDYIFSKIKQRKILILDGLDAILGKPIEYSEFTKYLRNWNEHKMKFRQLSQPPIVWPSLVIAYSTEPYSTLGIRGSVLENVGIVIELPYFSKEEIIQQSKKYSLPELLTEGEIEFLMKLTGGHPALLNRALEQVSQGITLSKLETKAFQLKGVFWDYLSFASNILEKNERFSQCLQKIINGEMCKDDDAKEQLFNAGIIKYDDDDKVIAIGLYQNYFIKIF